MTSNRLCVPKSQTYTHKCDAYVRACVCNILTLVIMCGHTKQMRLVDGKQQSLQSRLLCFSPLSASFRRKIYDKHFVLFRLFVFFGNSWCFYVKTILYIVFFFAVLFLSNRYQSRCWIGARVYRINIECKYYYRYYCYSYCSYFNLNIVAHLTYFHVFGYR